MNCLASPFCVRATKPLPFSCAQRARKMARCGPHLIACTSRGRDALRMTMGAPPHPHYLWPANRRSSFRSSTWQLAHASDSEHPQAQERADEDGGQGGPSQHSSHKSWQTADSVPLHAASSDADRNSVWRRVWSGCAMGLMGLSAAFFVAGGADNATGLSAAAGAVLRKLALARAVARARAKFTGNWKGALMIPIIAAFVGWFTNWLAVKMIFYPVEFWGVPIQQYSAGTIHGCQVMQPMGCVGWQGIVPAKAPQMALRLVEMVTSSLVSVPQVFAKLHPETIASLLQPELPSMAADIGQDLLTSHLPRKLQSISGDVMGHLGQRMANIGGGVLSELEVLQTDFLAGFTRELQRQPERVLDLNELVVKALADGPAAKSRLTELFQICGRAELTFLTNSGLWFGYLLGVLQMVLWMFWDNPWTLTVGGAVVGYLTNFMALKCIFEPVEPVQVGPFTLQGLFLKRQQQVSGEFSDYLTRNVLTSEALWNNMLFGSKSQEFLAVLQEYTRKFAENLSMERLGVLMEGYNVSNLDALAARMMRHLPEHVHVLHNYVDSTLGLTAEMRDKMKLLSTVEFEQVLHPIFQEDEFTLIVSGAILGAIAGAVQQYLTVAGGSPKAKDGDSDRLSADGDADSRDITTA